MGNMWELYEIWDDLHVYSYLWNTIVTYFGNTPSISNEKPSISIEIPSDLLKIYISEGTTEADARGHTYNPLKTRDFTPFSKY